MTLTGRTPQAMAVRMAGGLSGASTGALPWEDAGGGTSQTALLSSILAGQSANWLDYRTLPAGALSGNWTDRIGGSFAVSQASGPAQPTVGAGVVFNGTTNYIVSATNPLNGKSAFTIHVVGSMPAWAGATPTIISAGVVTGGGYRALLYANGASGLQTFIEGPAATTNNWNSGATAMALGVYTWQADLAAGANCTTDILKNGVTLNGTRSASGVTSGTFTTGSGFFIGAQNTTPSNPSVLTCLAVVIIPTVSGANNTQVVPLLRGIYGV